MYRLKITSFFVLSYLLLAQCKAQSKVISFENVNIIPMYKDTILYNQRVIISNNKIFKIQPNNEEPTIKINQKINAKNKFLIPGLVEAHYHLQNNIENEFKLLIANGITSARNMAEYPKQDHIKIRELTKSDSILSPHYYTTGAYLKRNDLKTVNDVKNVVSYHKKRGYDYLKIADNLPKEIYLKLLEFTDEENIEIVGHAQRKLPLKYSLRMKSIEHMEEFMNIFNEEEKNTNNFLKTVAKQIKNSGVYVSPTLGIFEMIGLYADKEKSKVLHKKEQIKYLPKHYADYWMSSKINYRSFGWFTLRKSLTRLENELKWQKKFTKILSDAKVPLIAGSDTYGLFIQGFSLHHELELIHSCGLSNYETLKTATINSARYLNRASMSGTIEEGKFADLVLLNKNPLEDIKNTKTILGVFLKGKWYNREKLDKMLLEVEKSVE